MSAENILCYAPAESGAETLALRPLHQNDERHQQRNQHVDGKDNVDENVHFGASNMFERRLGRKPVLPLILNGGCWIAKPLALGPSLCG